MTRGAREHINKGRQGKPKVHDSKVSAQIEIQRKHSLNSRSAEALRPYTVGTKESLLGIAGISHKRDKRNRYIAYCGVTMANPNAKYIATMDTLSMLRVYLYCKKFKFATWRNQNQ